MDLHRLKFNGKYLLKGLVLAYMATIILLIITAFLLTYTPLKESNIPLMNTIIIISSITVGAIYSAIKIGQKGWLNGGLFGILYFLTLFILNLLFIKDYTFDILYLSRFLVFTITGIIAGVLGINLS